VGVGVLTIQVQHPYPFYGDYSLRGRLSHNKFNIPLGLRQSITSTTILGYNGFKIGYPN